MPDLHADGDANSRDDKNYGKDVDLVNDSSIRLACRRCGVCCHVDMIAYAVTEDFQRWEKEGRHDIIARIRNNEVMWAGDRIISKSGRKLTTCFYLNWDGSSFSCEIYETRPLVCRNFIPGSSELCPQYFQRPRLS